MNGDSSHRSLGGQGLYSALAALHYPRLDQITPDSLDWLYEVGPCRPFLDWLAGKVGKENYLSPDELAAYMQIPPSELLSGSLLEEALAVDEPEGGELTNREREQLVARLEAELATQENCLEKMTSLKNHAVDQHGRDSMDRRRLVGMKTAAEKEESRARDQVLQVNAVHTACLEGLKDVMDGLILKYGEKSEQPVFLCKMQLDQLTQAEKELEEQLKSYISSQFGASFTELNLVSETQKGGSQTLDILDLDDDACLDLVRGRDRTEFDRLISEINRLRVSLHISELSRVEAAAEAAGLRALVASLNARKFGDVVKPLVNNSNTAADTGNQCRAMPLILLEGESYGHLGPLRVAVAELAIEMANLHCRQILTTDYEVKAKRSAYVLAKLDQLCDLMLERKARLEILESLVERECTDLEEVQFAIQSVITILHTAIRKSQQFRTAVKSLAKPKVAADSRSLIPVEDATLTKVHQILQISGEVGHLPTYSSVSEAVGQLLQQKADLEEKVVQRQADRQTHFHHIEQSINKLCRQLHLNEDGNRTGAAVLVPGEVSRGITQAKSDLRQLEQRLKQLLTAWDQETAELAAKPHLERLRQLWVDFLVHPQVLAPNLRAVQARAKE